MVKMTDVVKQYTASAAFYHDSDCVEYIKVDAFVIYDRVDEFLTLIFDKTGKNLVGFKLKGFKNIFTQQLESIYRLNEKQFLRLASAIEVICVNLGDQLFADDDRKRSYQAAAELAANDNVELRSFDLSDRIAA